MVLIIEMPMPPPMFRSRLYSPLALPIWYIYEDGDVIIGMGGNSLKAKLLRAAGRATMTVQTETPPYKYLMIEGPVVVLSENLARELWGQPGNAVGKRIRETRKSDWREVIGVVNDERECVIAADAFVERLLLGATGHRAGKRQQQGKDQTRKHGPLKT